MFNNDGPFQISNAWPIIGIITILIVCTIYSFLMCYNTEKSCTQRENDFLLFKQYILDNKIDEAKALLEKYSHDSFFISCANNLLLGKLKNEKTN